MNDTFKCEDTMIELGGVLRCCLATVASEYAGKTVALGTTSRCQHCGEAFTLVEIKPGMTTAYRNPTKPVWKPDWQLKSPRHVVKRRDDDG